MKNKEKYAKEIIEIACSGNELAVGKVTGEPIECNNIVCKECLLHNKNGEECSAEYLKEWAESEYIEKPVISKRDRMFLEYIGEKYKYIVRDGNKLLFAWSRKPRKSSSVDEWTVLGMLLGISEYNLDFPMVKWEDDEPWLIEALKKLEVVETYE